MTGVYVGVDASTSAVKVIAWSLDGSVVAEGRAPLELDNPAPNAWEQDATSYWSALRTACRQVTSTIDPSRIRGVSIACQRETFVATDDDGTPMAPALTWMDDRCADEVADVIAELDSDRLHAATGKPPCTTPSLYKIRFLLRRLRPELAARAPKIVDVHGFLAWRLSGERKTSLPAADPTGLVDLSTGRYDAVAVAAAGLVESQLSELIAASSRLGVVTKSASEATGLPEGCPIFAGAGDGQAAGLGAGIDAPGRAYLNLGTALVGGVSSSTLRISKAFRTLYAATPGEFFLETDLKGGTFTVSWLVDRLFPGALDLGELSRAAERLPAGSEGLMVLPYWSGVMNPYWDDLARGAVVGWKGHHTAVHLYRAVLEGLAFEQRLAFDGVSADAGPISEVVVMGGGSTSDLFCRICADVLGRPIVRAGTAEATSLGAGMIAAVGAGALPSFAAATQAMTKRGARFEVGPARDRYERLFRDVYVDLYPALRRSLSRLSMLA